MDSAWKELARRLPRVTEEGQDHEVISEALLVERLARDSRSAIAAETFVSSARRLLLATAVLDENECAKGNWRIVSFPALLFARSALLGLSDNSYGLIEKGFWESSDFLIGRQRNLLRELETRRRARGQGGPIRRVWVSWALIACDGRFLLVRREDPVAGREGSRGDFVLPGGRVSPVDLDGLDTEQRLAFFDPFQPMADEAKARAFLNHTLGRELQEEIEIGSGTLESIVAERPLISYVDTEGAKSAHGLTEYLIQTYRIALNDKGKTDLLHALARHPDRFTWFTPEELAAKRNDQGRTAYVDALFAASSGQQSVSLDARGCDLSIGSEETILDKIDVPFDRDAFLSIGKSGSERRIALSLTEDELSMLGVLAAIRRGDPVSDLAEGLAVVPGLGWVIVESPTILADLKTIANNALACTPRLPILAFHGKAVRINVASSNLVCFSAGALALRIADERRGKSYRLRLKRKEIRSPIGIAPAVERETSVAETLGSSIYELASGSVKTASDNLDTIKRLQRGEFETFLNSVGARLLIRQVDGVPELAVREASAGQG